TNVGRILDPVVDKLSVGCGVLFLLLLRDFPLWAALIIFGRDAAILVLVFLLIRKRELITSSNLLGKTTVTALAIMILLYIVEFQPHAAVSTYVAVCFVLLSGGDYVLSYVRIVRSSGEVRS
ncbi:MAG: CDP-alcohol phosphatidyltransferase family protein, partial [bacterium]